MALPQRSAPARIWVVDDDRAVLTRLEVAVEVCEFDDGHVWTDVFRDAAATFLDRVRTGAGPA